MDRHKRPGSQEQMASHNASYGSYKYLQAYSNSRPPNIPEDEDSLRTRQMSSRRYRNWALSALVSLALVLVTWPATLGTRASDLLQGDVPNLAVQVASSDPPRHSTNFSTAVQWDNYSLFLNDQRIFLHSGEFHTFRLPVPDLWLDIFQKMSAAGLNGASIYIHWALTNPAPGVIDFNDWRALQPMFDAAKQAGIWIVLRPGPYINAETTAGGLALWSTSLTHSTLRTNATDIEASWQQYVDAIIDMTVENQISNGGPVIAIQIDNEYSQSPIQNAEYFAQLEEKYRSNGIVIPLTYNDPGEGRNFINGTGAVDIYGLDSYPQGFDCSNPAVWRPVTTNYHDYHESVNPGQPFYMPEFQGGSFDPWGGPGYDACEVLTGPDFQDVFYKWNWASNVKLISYYMVYGGTNWGGLAEPGVYTSYGYGASIRENRALSPKFDELKRQGLFLRSSPEFRKTDWIGDSTTGIPGVNISNPAAFVTLLRNPDTGAGFYLVRQTNSTSTDTISYSLTVPTSRGTLRIPQQLPGNTISLFGRQSRVIVTDYSFGQSSKLTYSTARILFAGTIGVRDVILLYGDPSEGTEFAIDDSVFSFPPDSLKANSIQPVIKPKTNQSPLLIYADASIASAYFAPVIPNTSKGSQFDAFWQFGSNTTILVGGPNLVRNASISSDGSRLSLRGDLNDSTDLSLLVPDTVKSVTWNGKNVRVNEVDGIPGFLQGRLEFTLNKERDIRVPSLTGWKFQDSLPEVKDEFDDSKWVSADHTTTNITQKPLFGDGRVLYGCDYGFCENTVLWRGHFKGSSSTTAVNLTINGGSAFAASVFINSHFINTISSLSSEQANGLFTFPSGSVKFGQDNVVTAIQDHMGNDESPNERSPRGIPGFALTGGNFTTWKVQGKLGGYTNFPDKLRGILNEGGLFGERAGWHLPGFSTAKWSTRSPSQGLPNGPGVGFFVTTFELDVPKDVDAMFSFEFTETAGQAYRALLFVNGWQYGKRVANFGPQTKFPVPSGILDHNGKNTVALALWQLTPAAVSPQLKLVLDDAVQGGVGPIAVKNLGWTPRNVV
ncbi:glycoside hydrolase superfamily [Irpex rosettiformis]|uniref:Glycoside hydrolase superfamily n=1 Tax=Irpex rosettiformis TaxID=378272 RepID=A0ACB8UDM0_9APHY|nr:glycoside hydrolase superfamily [Irpex rosettiformis]